MKDKVVGPSVHSTADADGNHDQKKVKDTARAALDDPKLHFEPVQEFPGSYKGRTGTFKLFHTSEN